MPISIADTNKFVLGIHHYVTPMENTKRQLIETATHTHKLLHDWVYGDHHSPFRLSADLETINIGSQAVSDLENLLRVFNDGEIVSLERVVYDTVRATMYAGQSEEWRVENDADPVAVFDGLLERLGEYVEFVDSVRRGFHDHGLVVMWEIDWKNNAAGLDSEALGVSSGMSEVDSLLSALGKSIRETIGYVGEMRETVATGKAGE